MIKNMIIATSSQTIIENFRKARQFWIILFEERIDREKAAQLQSNYRFDTLSSKIVLAGRTIKITWLIVLRSLLFPIENLLLKFPRLSSRILSFLPFKEKFRWIWEYFQTTQRNGTYITSFVYAEKVFRRENYHWKIRKTNLNLRVHRRRPRISSRYYWSE